MNHWIELGIILMLFAGIPGIFAWCTQGNNKAYEKGFKMKYGTTDTDQFELDIKSVLSQEPEGSYSLNRKEFFYEDPFIQALWVGYQLGLVRAKLLENNKEKKKVPALLKP